MVKRQVISPALLCQFPPPAVARAGLQERPSSRLSVCAQIHSGVCRTTCGPLLPRRGACLRTVNPPTAEDGGMDLYEALIEHQIAWDEAEAAGVEEYRLLGRPVEGPEVVGRGDRTPLCRSFALCR